MTEATTPDDASEVTSGRLLRNTVINGVAYVSSALITAALTPYLLHRLGEEEYGLWVLALSITFTSGYLALADIGLPEAAVRFIAEAKAAGELETIDEIASTTLATFLAAGVVIGGAFAALAPLFVELFGVDDDLVGTARTLFVIMALEVVAELPSTALRAVIEGLQRYAALRMVDVMGRVLFGVLAVVAISGGHGVLALGAITLAITAVRALVTLVLAHRVCPGLRLRPSLVSRATLKRTAGYGSLVGGLRVLSVLYAQMDRAIIGILISVAAVASYEVVFRIQSLAVLALVMASSAVLPAAAYNAAREDHHKQRELYLRGTKYAMALALPVCIGAILFAELLIRTWVGEQFADLALSARIFLAFPVLSSVNQVGIAMLIGLGQAKRVLLYQVISVGTNLVVSIALAERYGIEGVVIGTLVGGLVTWVPYLRLLLTTFAVDLATWARRTALPNLLPAIAQLAVGLVLVQASRDVDRLLVTLALYGATCLVYAAVFAITGLSALERSHLVSRFIGRGGPPPPQGPLPVP